jgi:hypothetical protein
MQRVSVQGTRNKAGQYQESTGCDQKICKRERHSGNHNGRARTPRVLRDVAADNSVSNPQGTSRIAPLDLKNVRLQPV